MNVITGFDNIFKTAIVNSCVNIQTVGDSHTLIKTSSWLHVLDSERKLIVSNKIEPDLIHHSDTLKDIRTANICLWTLVPMNEDNSSFLSDFVRSAVFATHYSCAL